MSISGQIYLARELKDLILNHLDKGSIAACTLLTRDPQWHAVAREHLFRKIVIHDKYKNHNHNLFAFHQLLDSGCTEHTLKYIKGLTICGESSVDTELTAVDLGRILMSLPGLDSLHLEKVWIQTSAGGSSLSFPPPSLKELHLEHVYLTLEIDLKRASGTDDEPIVPSQFSLVELLRLFKSIDVFHLRHIEFTWHSALEQHANRVALLRSVAHREGQKVATPLGVIDFALVAPKAPNFLFLLEMITNSSTLGAVQRLEVSPPDKAVSDVESILPRVALTLDHVHIHLHHTEYLALITFNLSSCRKLRSLRLSSDFHVSGAIPVHRGDKVGALFRTAQQAPQSITELEIELRYHRHYPQGRPAILQNLMLDWEALDKNLSSRAELMEVQFVINELRSSICGEPLPEVFAQEIELVKRGLPLLLAKKRVDIKYVEAGST
ncbi:hypothetical protein BXZ70DRAFT_758214 [Cristinia sonorae]|uniref:Uncharacterized protein n=1 Tax=Cristinia sonorae TaxID=1940300 RepID=A0A8K0UTG4_9AGAR|nr:hypothetical protein BXZ70DRAFT_758214 [Cristinia sonorae]